MQIEHCIDIFMEQRSGGIWKMCEDALVRYLHKRPSYLLNLTASYLF
jgi:hypothetical protein